MCGMSSQVQWSLLFHCVGKSASYIVLDIFERYTNKVCSTYIAHTNSQKFDFKALFVLFLFLFDLFLSSYNFWEGVLFLFRFFVPRIIVCFQLGVCSVECCLAYLGVCLFLVYLPV